MKTLTLPHACWPVVAACLIAQATALVWLSAHEGLSLWLCLLAFFIGGFVTDWISGLAHFGFDYVWPSKMPILGPIADDFRGHHLRPGLDPSAKLVNFTKGAYGGLPAALITLAVIRASGPTPLAFLVDSSLLSASIWMLGFHQIHSYAHMGKSISAEEFNRAVERIVRLPTTREQNAEFAALFARVGIPKSVRILQRCRLFLRPEIHWRHHHTFETDFSSVNGWSDPVMNPIYGRLARRWKSYHIENQTHPSPEIT